MEIIVKTDFPERFEPTNKICLTLESNENIAELSTAMAMLKQIVKKFQLSSNFEEEHKRRCVVEATFPAMESLLKKLIPSISPDSSEAFKILEIALKCFKMANLISLESKFLGEQLDFWMSVI